MNKRQQQLNNESIHKLLLRMSLPSMISLCVYALYNIIDAQFVAMHSDGSLGLAGLTIAFPLQMLLLAVGQMFGIGAASVYSRSVGQRDFAKANNIIGVAISASLGIGLFMSVAGFIFTEKLCLLFGSDAQSLPYAKSYLQIIIAGGFISVLSISISQMVRGEGNAIFSMLAMIIGSVLNIPLDYLFVIVLDMGVSGAAIATVIGSAVSLILLILYVFSKKSTFSLSFKDFTPTMQVFKEIFATGLPSFFLQVLGVVTMTILNISIRRLGNTSLYAITGIINRVMSLVFMPINGLMYGLIPIIGYNYGAKLYDRVKKTIGLSISFASILCIVSFIIVQLFAHQIIKGFISPSDSVYATAVYAFRVVNLLLPLGGVQVLAAGICQSMGNIRHASICAVSRNIMLALLFLAASPLFGFTGIVWTFPIVDVVNTGIAGFIMIISIKNLSQMNMAIKAVEA